MFTDGGCNFAWFSMRLLWRRSIRNILTYMKTSTIAAIVITARPNAVNGRKSKPKGQAIILVVEENHVIAITKSVRRTVTI